MRLGPTTVPSILHLQGPLDYNAVEAVLNEIVGRHSALRATFFHSRTEVLRDRAAELNSLASTGVFKPGLYLQTVLAHARLTLRTLDLSDCTSPEQDAAIRRAIQREAAVEFDYEKPPLFRAALIRAGTAEHFLILIVDHLVSDAWSMRIIRREFAQLYLRLTCSGRNPFEEPRLSYPRYAVLQDEMVKTGAFARSLNYWQQQWSAFASSRIGFEDLPFSLPQPEVPTLTFRSECSTLDLDTGQAVRRFARQARVTLYMLFLSIHCWVLRRYTGKAKLAVWGHFANRMRPEIHHSVGWFANTHLIGIEADGTSVHDVLLNVRRAILDGSEHQEMPVGLLWRTMGLYPRHPDARLLVDVSVADEPTPGAPQTAELMIHHAAHLNPSYGRFSNLGLYIRDDRERITLSIQYAADRFPQGGVRQLLDELQNEVISLVRGSEARGSCS